MPHSPSCSAAQGRSNGTLNVAPSFDVQLPSSFDQLTHSLMGRLSADGTDAVLLAKLKLILYVFVPKL